MPRRAHLIGVAGAGMRSLAGVLLEAGWQLSGSDSGDISGLPGAIRIERGHAAECLALHPDAVIYSPAIDPQHRELLAAHTLGIPAFSYPEILGHLMRDRFGIAVAGTHGKSTVVGMIGSILMAAELDPLIVCGAECSRFGRGPHFVAEACEYRSSFLHLRPQVGAILNVEPDHFDYYPSADHLETAFLEFAQGVDPNGTLVAAADCPTTACISARSGRACATFGIDSPADWRATVLSASRADHRFLLERHGQQIAEIRLRVPGRHNLRNAIAAAAVAGVVGVSPAGITRGLEAFAGLNRRLQTLGTARGITVIDDYAHHPTEIAAALETVRQQHPSARITCVFEPHQASRTQSLRVELAASLQKADTLAVMDIFRAREGAWQPGEITADVLADQIRASGTEVFARHGADEIKHWIQHRVANGLIAEGDIVLTLGAGRIGELAHGVYQWIREICSDR